MIDNILDKYLNESSLSRVWKHATEHDTGTITAFRSARECGSGETYTRAENMKRNKQLESKLKMMGYGITKVKGTYIENFGTADAVDVSEESFLVVDLKDKGTLKADLIKLGEMFEQDSITYSKPSGEYYLISTNKCPNGYPGNGKIGVEVKLGKPLFGKKGEFHSKVNGRPFVFEHIQDRVVSLRNHPPTEIRSIKALSEQTIK